MLACREPPPHEQHPDAVLEECRTAALDESQTFEWWLCDMANFASVERFAKRWLETGRSVDVLCNNAGIPNSKKRVVTKDGNEIIHQVCSRPLSIPQSFANTSEQVNFLSHVLMTMYLLPSLAKAPEPRIIFTVSSMQFFGIFDLENPNASPDPYAEAKIFLQTFLTELQGRMLKHEKYRHITTQGVHPGFVLTGIWDAAKADDPKPEPEKQSWIGWAIIGILHQVAIDAQQGSLAITYAATQPECGADPAVQGVGAKNGRGGGRYWNRTWEEEPMPQTRTQGTRDLLWAYIEKALRLGERGLLEDLGSLAPSAKL